MTTRERRLARAERLREWADKREVKAEQANKQVHQIADMIPFGQPILVGHHSEGRARRDQDRIHNGMRATVEHGRKADSMRSRADNIEAAVDNAIYSDDEDAVERLEEKLARLEATRARIKAENAVFRKEHRAELAALSAYERHQAMPHASYELTNLSGRISAGRKRLALLRHQKVHGRPKRGMYLRYAGECADCQVELAKDAFAYWDGDNKTVTCGDCYQRKEQ